VAYLDDEAFAQRLAERRAEPRYEGHLAATFTHARVGGDVSVVACHVVSLSTSAMVIGADVQADAGEHIWVDIDGFGIVRCEVEQVREGGFICFNLMREDARKRLGSWVALLRRRGGRVDGDHRQFMRTRPRDARTTLTFVTGEAVDARLADVSRSGAAVHCVQTASVGEAVSVGRVPAHVVRPFDGGFAVSFDFVLEAADADRLVAGYEIILKPLKQAI
jgi:hypothetical protein